MTVTYPLAFPTVNDVQSIVVKTNDIVAKSRSIFTGTEQVYAHQGQYWSASVSLVVMKRVRAAPWVSFFAKLRGAYGTFYLYDPDCLSPQGSASVTPATPQINGAGQTGNTLNIKNADPGATGYLLAGDYIQLGTGASTRLHMVLNDVDIDSAGSATIDIWPSLRESPTNSAAVVVENCKGVFRLTQNVSFPKDVARFYSMSFDCIEALNV